MQTAHLNLLAAARPGLAPSVSVLLGDGPALEGAMRRLLAGLPQTVRVVRAGNPLRSPLTVERILIQAGKEELGLLPDDAADEAMQRLCQRRNGETQVVLVIEQAETLGLGALRALSRLAAPNGRPAGGAFAPLHLVLAGHSSLRHMLIDPAAAVLRAAMEAAAPLPPATPEAPVPATSSAAVAMPPAAQRAVQMFQPIPILAHPALAKAEVAVPVLPLVPSARMNPVLQAVLVLSILSALGAGAVAGLPYALQWLGFA